MTLSEAIEHLLGGQSLDRSQARGIMDVVMGGEATPAQIAGLLIALRARGETVEEMAGFVDSMRTHATPLELPDAAIDTCGTGGDRANTFNISTAAALVAAGAGIKVAKHGNRAASSRCGSADVLEALGVAIALGPAGVRACVEEAGIGFCFAPMFHPSMRHVASARSELGVRTIFNVLGPLANPARVRRQALGVGAPALAPLMVRVLQQLGHERALVFYGEDGLDELTTAAASRVFQLDGGSVREYRLDPQEFGLGRSTRADLLGGTPAENAAILRRIFEGEQGPRRQVVLLNAAAAALAAGVASDFPDGIGLSAQAIDNGGAGRALDRLVRTSAARKEPAA